ncbi:hypothetical protein B0H14DRAFT_2658509 [Mycena olivaceomarginata]|nr:hypothetical protein B0H14DRAFT_2658509 [Mycena olivaceomarginata]
MRQGVWQASNPEINLVSCKANVDLAFQCLPDVGHQQHNHFRLKQMLLLGLQRGASLVPQETPLPEELLSLPNTQPPAFGLPLPNKSPVVLPRQLPWSILATYRRCWKRFAARYHKQMDSNLSGQPSTPARQAMNRLVTQMSAQTAMASPGPRLHAPGAGSDGESEPGSNAETSDSETGPLPVHRMPAWRPRPLAQDDEEIVISLNSDDDTAEPVPSCRKHHSDKWHGFSVDGDSFAWAEATHCIQAPDQQRLPSLAAIRRAVPTLRDRVCREGSAACCRHCSWRGGQPPPP